MAKRTIAVSMLALSILIAACGGESAPPGQPASGVESTNTVSEADALATAQEAAIAQGLSLEGLTPKPANLFGEWQISFEPSTGTSLAGGFLVVLDDDTGELIDIIEYQ